MAADVTLLALPATSDNWRRAQVQTFQELLLGDTVEYDDVGNVVACGYDLSGPRSDFSRAVYDDVDWLEVGPVSFLKAALTGDDVYLPAPTIAVQTLWNKPQIVTRTLVTCTMVAMNLPDRSMYRTWRKARRQHVKRWLVAHAGQIVWAEPW